MSSTSPRWEDSARAFKREVQYTMWSKCRKSSCNERDSNLWLINGPGSVRSSGHVAINCENMARIQEPHTWPLTARIWPGYRNHTTWPLTARIWPRIQEPQRHIKKSGESMPDKTDRDPIMERPTRRSPSSILNSPLFFLPDFVFFFRKKLSPDYYLL